MSNGFIEITKPQQNITDGYASYIQYRPLNKKNNKKFELLYVREYKQVRNWNKSLFR